MHDQPRQKVHIRRDGILPALVERAGTPPRRLDHPLFLITCPQYGLVSVPTFKRFGVSDCGLRDEIGTSRGRAGGTSRHALTTFTLHPLEGESSGGREGESWWNEQARPQTFFFFFVTLEPRVE